MVWVLLGMVSAMLLGVYDIFKKLSLRDNAVMPVLFLSTLTSSLLFLPILLVSHSHPELSGHFWYIKPQNLTAHIHFFVKSIIVGSSWVLAYFAVKNLPITIASPHPHIWRNHECFAMGRFDRYHGLLLFILIIGEKRRYFLPNQQMGTFHDPGNGYWFHQ